MTIDLHPEARKRLVTVLAEALRGVRVANNSFLDYASVSGLAKADGVLPAPSSTTGRYVSALVSTEPVADFVAGRLARSLARRDYTSGASAALHEIDDFQDTTAVAEALVSEFVTLPWNYDIVAALPPEVGNLVSPAVPFDGLPLNNQLRLATGAFLSSDHITPDDHPPPSLLSDGPTQLIDDSIYLCVRVSGYIPRYGATIPIDEGQGLVRAFFGLCSALRLVRFGASYSFGLQKRQLFVFKSEQEFWRRESDHDMPVEAAQALAGLGHNEKIGALDDEVRARWVRQELGELQRALARVDESRPLLLAAQWLFDSWASSNRLLGFVQAMVALEALLGEKATSDVIGLGELLANRTAFLIAKTRQQRDEIIADFRRIYGTRSTIIHRGKNRLTTGDLRDFSRLEWLCARVIQEEIRLLAAGAV